MEKQQYSVAVIGAGMAGRTHANAWRQVGTIYDGDAVPEVRLATICDAYLPFAESAAKNYGYEKATDNWRDIVDDPNIDIVSIVVANRLHREISEALVKAGKHVLCEKPLTDTLEDAQAMAEFAQANPEVVTGIGFAYRRHPSIAQVARLVDEGALGEVVQFNGRYWADYGADPAVPIAWRYKGPMGSGALGDLGSHITDLAEFICGPIKVVSGATFAKVFEKRPPAVEGLSGGRGRTTLDQATEDVENDDIALFNAHFQNGAIGAISVSRVAYGLPNALMFDVMGTDGHASFDLARSGEIKLDSRDTAPDTRGSKQVLASPDFPYFANGSSMAFTGVGTTQIEQFTYQARAFLDQVAGVDEGLPPVPSFAHGYRVMRIQAAVAESAAKDGAAVIIE